MLCKILARIRISGYGLRGLLHTRLRMTQTSNLSWDSSTPTPFRFIDWLLLNTSRTDFLEGFSTSWSSFVSQQSLQRSRNFFQEWRCPSEKGACSICCENTSTDDKKILPDFILRPESGRTIVPTGRPALVRCHHRVVWNNQIHRIRLDHCHCPNTIPLI